MQKYHQSVAGYANAFGWPRVVPSRSACAAPPPPQPHPVQPVRPKSPPARPRSPLRPHPLAHALPGAYLSPVASAKVRRASKSTGLLPAAPPPRVAASDSAAAAAAAACREEEETEEPWVVQGLSRDAAAALVTAHLVAHAQALRRAHPASGAPVLTVRRPAPPVLYHFHSDADQTPEPDKSPSSSSVNDSEKAEDIKNMCATFQRVTFRGMKSDHTDVAEESKSKKKRDEDAITDPSNAESYGAPILTKTDGGKAFFPSQIHSVNKERLFHIGGGSNPGATDVIPIPTKLVPNVDHRN